MQQSSGFANPVPSFPWLLDIQENPTVMQAHPVKGLQQLRQACGWSFD